MPGIKYAGGRPRRIKAGSVPDSILGYGDSFPPSYGWLLDTSS